MFPISKTTFKYDQKSHKPHFACITQQGPPSPVRLSCRAAPPPPRRTTNPGIVSAHRNISNAYVQQFSTRGGLAMSEDTSGCHNSSRESWEGGRECYLNLVGGGQKLGQTSHNAQDRPHTTRMLQKEMTIEPRVRNTAYKELTMCR